MGRKTARDTAMKLLYGQLLGGGELLTIEETIEPVGLTEDDMQYIESVRKDIADKSEAIDALIGKYAVGWSTERMARVDLAILRIAVYEMLYRDEVPSSVAINEAIELSKKYSGDEAGSFINGVLAAILRSQSEEAGASADADA